MRLQTRYGHATMGPNSNMQLMRLLKERAESVSGEMDERDIDTVL